MVVCRDEYQVQTHETRAAVRSKDARNKGHRNQELPTAYSNKDLTEQGIKQQRPPGTRSSGSFRHQGPPGERKNGAQKNLTQNPTKRSGEDTGKGSKEEGSEAKLEAAKVRKENLEKNEL